MRVSYFAGGGERDTWKTLSNVCGFVLGLTAVFLAIGALAGTLDSPCRRYQTMVNAVSGLIVIFFGLNYLEEQTAEAADVRLLLFDSV